MNNIELLLFVSFIFFPILPLMCFFSTHFPLLFDGNVVVDTDNRRTNSSDRVHGIDLHLHRSNKLLDDNFVFIKRDDNQTQLIDDFDKLAEKYSNCFYRNENSAIDLCDGNVVSILMQLFSSRLKLSHR